MQITCPECRGARTMRYIDPEPMPDGPIYSAEATATLTASSHIEDCRTCKGVGAVNATERIPVFQEYWITATDGTRQRSKERIGTVPPDFDPSRISSRNYFYDPRPGDFKWEDETWVAAYTLGPGDLEAVPGFVWNRE